MYPPAAGARIRAMSTAPDPALAADIELAATLKRMLEET